MSRVNPRLRLTQKHIRALREGLWIDEIHLVEKCARINAWLIQQTVRVNRTPREGREDDGRH